IHLMVSHVYFSLSLSARLRDITYSWPCLHQWLEMRPNRKECPVCKAGISQEKVIPLYGRGSSSQQDPRYVSPYPPTPLSLGSVGRE
ncbi:hypothetical protein chiPu_0026558, partial [Chiloscyllium punctatum]|nr:hypothetical protein [Chiloscyllium punctatum]